MTNFYFARAVVGNTLSAMMLVGIMLFSWYKVTLKYSTNTTSAIHHKDVPTAKEWSILQLLDPHRNSLNTLNTINRTFFPSGYPRLTESQNLHLEDWCEDIVLQYPSFKMPEPKFVRERDQELFYAHPENRKLLKDSKTELLGQIRIVYGAYAHNRIQCGWGLNLMDFVDTSEVINALPNGERNYTTDKVVPILTPDSHSFQHFLDGVLPKIIQVLPFLRLPGIKLALQKPRDKIIKLMLAKMQLYDKVIWVDGSEVVTSRFQINTCITPPLHPLLWKAMREELGVSDIISQDASKFKVMLLNRAQSHNGGRNIKNQHEIIKYLSKRYTEKFVVYKPQTSLAKTKQLFADVHVIIGVHGGALYNLNFAPKQCHVIELMPTSRTGHVTRRLAHTIMWQMAAVIGQPYWRIALPPIDDFDNVILPLDRLTEVLDKVDQFQQHRD